MAAPLKRLSTFYFLYFALLGCIAPYWGLYLQQRGFNAETIGTLMGAFAMVRVLSPNIWAYCGRYFSSPLTMVRLAGFLTAASFLLVWWVQSASAMLLLMVAYGFFWAAMLPQYESATLALLKNQLGQYSRMRLWGSVGFIVVVAGLGWLFESLSLAILPAVMLAIMLLIIANSFSLTAEHFRVAGRRPSAGGFRRALWSLPVLAFLLVTVLQQLSHGSYYTFFSIYLSELGYQADAIGMLWALGVCAEVILFWRFADIMHWLSWRQWLLLSLALTAGRWLLIAWQADSLAWLLLAQCAHAFSFGALHIVGMHYIQRYFPGALSARGQALYSSLGFGLGGALGAWLAGWLWLDLGGEKVFTISALTAIVAMLIVVMFMDNDEKAGSSQRHEN